MGNDHLAKEVAGKLAERIDRSKKPIPVGVSNRHAHLTQEHWDILFGKDAQPRKFRAVKQPGFYAAYETISVEGPKGRIDNVRLVAPHRSKTQIEISKTDGTAIGLRPPVRDSGKLEGSVGVKLIGPAGSVEIKEGVILAKRHIHFAPEEAKAFGLKEGDIVRVRAGIGGDRELVFEKVLCRVSDQFALEFHVDTDEANASLVKSGDDVHIV